MSIASRSRFGCRGWTQLTVIMALGIAVVVAFMGNLGIAADEPDEEKFVTQIFIGYADGTEMRQLADLPEYQSQGSPSWSKDGKRIAFDAYKPQNGEKLHDAHLIVVDSDGTNARDLGRGLMPSLSPSGQRVVYSVRAQDGQSGIWIVDVDDAKKGGHGFKVLYEGEISECVDWTPDGKRIIVAMRVPNQNEHGGLFTLDVKEPSEPRLFPNELIDRKVRDPSFSPDGEQLAVQAFKKTPAAKE